MKRLAVSAVLGYLIAGLVACGGGGGGELAYLDYCEQRAKAICDWYNRCGGAAGLAAMGYSSIDDCTTQLEAQASCTGTPCLVSGLYHGTYHPDNAQICLDASKKRGCSDTLPIECRDVCTYK
jgi:hypothetical protein